MTATIPEPKVSVETLYVYSLPEPVLHEAFGNRWLIETVNVTVNEFWDGERRTDIRVYARRANADGTVSKRWPHLQTTYPGWEFGDPFENDAEKRHAAKARR